MIIECIKCKSEDNIIYPYTNDMAICTKCFDSITPRFAKVSEEKLKEMYSKKDNK